MNLDPNFPNRPTHPDFAAMSEMVIAHDELTEVIEIDAIIGRYADIDSVDYMAIQRALRGCIANGLPAWVLTVLASMWVDGFCLGVGLERSR